MEKHLRQEICVYKIHEKSYIVDIHVHRKGIRYNKNVYNGYLNVHTKDRDSYGESIGYRNLLALCWGEEPPPEKGVDINV